MKHYSRASMNEWSTPDPIPDRNQKMIDVYEEKIRYLEREIEKIRNSDRPENENVKKREIPPPVPVGTGSELVLRRNLNRMKEQRDEAITRMLSFQKELTAVMKDLRHLQVRCNDMVQANELLLQVATGMGKNMCLNDSRERVKVEWTGEGRISSPSFTRKGYGVRVNASRTLLTLKEGSEEGVACIDGSIDLRDIGVFHGFQGVEVLDAKRSHEGSAILIEIPGVQAE